MLITNNLFIKYFQLKTLPTKAGFDRKEKVSTYLTIGELFDASKSLDPNEFFTTGIPIDTRLLAAHTYIREQLGSAVWIGSAYRTPAWETSKGRSTNGQHPQAKALDINGKGVIEFIETALKEKNVHYYKLRELGINSFGMYDWGVHMDTRTKKANGDIYYWDDRKKKILENSTTYAIAVPLLLLLGYFGYKRFQKMKK